MESIVRKVVAHAAAPLKWLIVLGMAYTLATTALFFAAPEEAASVQPRQPVARESGSTRPGADPENIIAANLFGVASTEPTEPAAAADARETLAETRLPLVLNGVFVAENAEDSTAILARKGRSEELYHIGDRVPGNATLDAVFLDHVLLRRGRALERLTFPQSDEIIVASSPRAESAAAESLNAPAVRARSASPATPPPARRDIAEPTPEELAEQYRAKLRDDPQQALGELGLTPLGGDDPAGYRLDRLGDSPYLLQTGLRPGDVILSINGQPVGDIGRDRLELDNVLAQGSARMEVQRGERRFFITASLN